MTRARVLIAGVSTRALAQSAVGAGYLVAAVDAFGDLDHQAQTLRSFAHHLRAPYSAPAAARASRAIPCDAVCYVSNFENHPRAVELLACGRALWGNSPAVLKLARDPLQLSRVLRRHALPALAVRASPPSTPAACRTRWLVKPRASGGGHSILPWRPGDPFSRHQVLQQRISGVPASLVFVADGQQAVPFGFSRLLAGDPAFGAGGFTYCGNILGGLPDVAAADWQALLDTVIRAAHVLTAAFGLRGVNGLDVIVRDRQPWVIELNPRHTASMELAERAFGFSVFHAHARACAGALVRFDLRTALRNSAAAGKAIVHARRDTIMGDTRHWLDDPSVRDVPHPGERIARGRPICTVFARARSSNACYAALVRRAQKLYSEIDEWRGNPA